MQPQKLPEEHPLGIPSQPNPNRKMFIGVVLSIVLMLVLMGLIFLQLFNDSKPKSATTIKVSKVAVKSTTPQKQNVKGLQLDPTKDYGNKYANGILPVGDNKYSTSEAKRGYIYMCDNHFVPSSQAGAQVRGPWFIGTAAYDINKKAHVDGQEVWAPSLSVAIKDGKRIITTNDLPNHVTGVFPVSSKDPAYAYDRNPNTISAQSLTYNLASAPVYSSPVCMGGEVGVMLTGVALFNGFDAGGRDAGAWEVQDNCDGHPQNKGEYHYHSLSSCITDTSVSTVIGYALDGFPITGPMVAKNNILTTDDLDECHGLTSKINLDNKKITSYHYVMTQDFPYSASCFRAAAVDPPGQHESVPTHP